MTRARRNRTESALPGLEDAAAKRGGPVYRGVREQLAALRKDDPEAADLLAGVAAAARSLAHTIDLASGYGGHKVETYALGQLHRELRSHLEVLAGRGSGPSDADELAAILNGTPATPAEEPAEAPA